MLRLFNFPLTLHFVTVVSSLFYSLASLKSRVSTTSCLVQRQITMFFKSIVNLFFCRVLDAVLIALHPLVTWCTQRMSTLFQQHMEGTGVSRIRLPRGTARHHSCWRKYHEHTPDYHQHRWSHVNACGRSAQSSDTHDTLRSIQMDSHSVRASSALSHVTWRSRQRRVLHGRELFSEKDLRCTDGLDTQRRICILQFDAHSCTCHTLDCEEDIGSSFRHHSGRTILHPLCLNQNQRKSPWQHDSKKPVTKSVFQRLERLL